jgi:hypothetical protein
VRTRPIKHHKGILFADYQGGRTTQGIETGRVAVPSLANRAGDFSEAASTLTGSVSGVYMAQLLVTAAGL